MQSIELNPTFELAFRFVTETNENIFLTGKAGTGKTTFLKYLKDSCSKNIIVAAPTGVAAINAGGVTLHSLFQLPFHPFVPTRKSKEELVAKIRFNNQRIKLLQKMELLVIDEISMVRCDVMDAIDTILKSVRRNYDIPFGGVQLLCIGDLYQLPPVAQHQEWNILNEYYTSPFFFDSIAIKEQMPLLIELNKIYRQKEESFVALLNKVRNNKMDKDDFDALHLRFIPDFKPSPEEKYITLTSHNNQADVINQKKLQQLHTSSFTYKAIIEDDFPPNMYPADENLLLKEGAQVMFLKNDTLYKRYFNGKIGVVKKVDKDVIIVDCDGDEINVGLETWENSRYSLNRTDGKLEQEVLGTFSQYPLRLAWAITIHKSQGLTFDKVMIDASAAFSSGQVYVALSRCTSLNGIVLLSKIPPAAVHNNDNVVKGQQSLQHKGSLAQRFEGARHIFTVQLLENLFLFEDAMSAAGQLEFKIKQQVEKLNKEATPWIENIVSQIKTANTTGVKFISKINEMLKQQKVIENNQPLQQRLTDAANHFMPSFNSLKNSVVDQPLITEHKESATAINECLQQLYTSLFTTEYCLQYCLQPFTLTGFLQHKIKLAQPKVNITCYASGKKQTNTDVPNPELYDTLRRWRDMIVEETAQPIYLVLAQNALKEVCTYLPFTKKDLLLLSGFGKAKVEQYGDDILEAVESYCSRHSLETNIAAKQQAPKRQRVEKEKKPSTFNTKTETLNLYKTGKTIEEIAAQRNLAPSTIAGHLTDFIKEGKLEVSSIVSQNKQKIITEIINANPGKLFAEIKTLLGDDYSYVEIRAVVNHMLWVQSSDENKE